MLSNPLIYIFLNSFSGDSFDNNMYISLLLEEYLFLFIFFMVAIILAVIIMSLSYILSIQNPDSEKLSTYECGFEPYEDSRNSVDIKFYLTAILFIVFDIEAVFLYPWCISLSELTITGFWSMIDFIIELGVGFVYVWFIGALNWD